MKYTHIHPDVPSLCLEALELDPQQVEDQVTGWTRTLKKLRIGFEDGGRQAKRERAAMGLVHVLRVQTEIALKKQAGGGGPSRAASR